MIIKRYPVRGPGPIMAVFLPELPMTAFDIARRREEAIIQWAEGLHRDGIPTVIKTRDQLNVLFGTGIAAVRAAKEFFL